MDLGTDAEPPAPSSADPSAEVSLNDSAEGSGKKKKWKFPKLLPARKIAKETDAEAEGSDADSEAVAAKE